MIRVLFVVFPSTKYHQYSIAGLCWILPLEDLALYHGVSRTGVGVGNLVGVPVIGRIILHVFDFGQGMDGMDNRSSGPDCYW